MRLATTTTGTLHVGKDYEGSSGWFGNGGEYIIAGTGNYPMDFWTNTVKRLSILADGNVNFAGTGQRITGDFSNATINNRLSFQTSTTNGATRLQAIPNGTGNISQMNFWGSSDPTNASFAAISLSTGAGNANIQSGASGTGTFLPLAFYTNNVIRMQIETNGDLKFDSGYGSAATAYGCRAWVNFNGTAASNLTGTYSQTGTTVTVTITGHGYITGNSAYLDFTSGSAVDGQYEVTVTDANTFTVTQASRTTSGNVTDRRNTINASGNVSSVADNATGNYTVNFTNAMPDTNYVAAGTTATSESASNTNGLLTVKITNGFNTKSCNVFVTNTSAAAVDRDIVTIAFFR
jgi:hypothetical protein